MLKRLIARLFGRRRPFGSSRTAASRAAPSSPFSTPEGAILALEDAYRHRNLELCVAAKDFGIEAEFMMWTLSVDASDEATVAKTAATLEAAYRAELQSGFPDMSGVVSTFPEAEPIADRVVLVTEVSTDATGDEWVQRVLAAETAAGWRVLNVVE